jgi:uncharacterized protein (DUF1501 family)
MPARLHRRHRGSALLMPDASWGGGSDHTLVVVFLRGGADTLSILPPYGDDRYYRSRPTLAVAPPGTGTRAAIRLDDHYSLHPDMLPLEAAYREGRLTFVQGVGIDNASGSHFECQDQMEHGDGSPNAPAGGGWLGRFLRSRADAADSPLSAVAIGTGLPESLRGAPSASVMERLEDIAIRPPGGNPEQVIARLASLYGPDMTLLGERGRQTLDLFRRLSELGMDSPTTAPTDAYPVGRFGDALRQVARLVRAEVGLRVACLDLPGWDTHFFQGSTDGQQAGLIGVLARGLAAFERDLPRHGGRFTVLVTTEFGRRFYENASQGTDHGRGFAALLLGDRVAGGRVVGTWPLDEIAEPALAGPGGLTISLDARSLFAEVLQGSLAATNAQLATVFPGLKVQRLGLFAI